MIDCHCHLADERLFDDIDAVLLRSRQNGLRCFVLGGVSPDEWERQEKIVARYPEVLPCFGLHPVWVAGHDEKECAQGFAKLEERIKSAAAVGETGLDFRKPYAFPAQKTLQLKMLRAHLELARAVRKPVVLHVVQAHQAALTEIRAIGANLPASGIVHGFTGSVEIAEEWLKLGFYISFGTRLLFKQNQRLRDLAATLPVDRILVESDAPDQAPPGHPSLTNEPWTTLQVIAMIAAVKNMDAGLLQDQIMINAGRLFGREFLDGNGNHF